MTPPHTRFKLLFRNRLSHHSSHLSNGAKVQYSSIETLIPPKDGFDSLDQPHNLDELNRGLKQPDINCIDCASSGSDNVSDEQASPTVPPFEVGNFAVGPPRHFTEAHVARQNVVFSTSISYGTILYPSPESQASTLTTTTSSAYSPPQPSNSYSTPLNGTSSCSVVSIGPSSGSYSPTQSSSSCAGCLTPSSENGADYPTDTPTIFSVTFETLTTTATSLQPVLSIVPFTSTVMVSSPLPQPTSVPDTNSNSQSTPNIAAIIGGTIGAVALLVLLFLIVICYRRKQQLSVTPFNFLESTAGPTHIVPRAQLKCRSTSDAVRPSIRGPSFAQIPDASITEHSGNRWRSFVTDPVSSHLSNNDDISTSSVVRRDQVNQLEQLVPYPFSAHGSDHYCHCRVESWIEQMVMENGSQEPSEELPAYRSKKSLKSGETEGSKS